MPVSGILWPGAPREGDDCDCGSGLGGGGWCRDCEGSSTDAPGGGFAALRRYSVIFSAYASLREDTES